MKAYLIFFIVLMTAFSAKATRQIQDELIYQGKMYKIGGYGNFPLEKYFDALPKEDIYKWYDLRRQKNTEKGRTTLVTTACYRGHVGSWIIESDMLVMTAVQLKLIDGKMDPVEVLKPFFGDKIKNGKLIAFWFTGHITLKGKNEILFFKNGKLTDIQYFESNKEMYDADRKLLIAEKKRVKKAEIKD